MSSNTVSLHAAPRGVRLEPLGVSAILDDVLAAHRKRAHAEGYALAVEESAGALQSAAEKFEAAAAERRDSDATDAVALALAIARKLLHLELVGGGHDIEAIVRDLLRTAAVQRGDVAVHLNPADAERLASVRFRKGTTIEADYGVKLGCAHVETPHGILVHDIEAAVVAIGERVGANLRPPEIDRRRPPEGT